MKDSDRTAASLLDDEAGFSLKPVGTLKKRKTADITASPVGVGFETLDRQMFNHEMTYEHLATLGAKWARCQTGWSRCETTKGEYDFGWLDNIVDKLLVAGVNPWFSISFGNQLYMPDAPHVSAVGCMPLYYGEETVQAWKNYVKALTEHFKDRVTHYEVWNEPNISCFWHGHEPSPEDYTELVKITAAEVKAVMPEAVMIGGAVSGCGFSYIERMLQAGVTESIDKITFHPYSMVPELGYANAVAYLKKLVAKYDETIKLWQGENGCPSVSAGHNDDWLGIFNNNETVQAKWVIRRVLSDLRHEIEFTEYFHIADLMEQAYRQADGTERKPVMMGLLNGKTYTPKKSFYALQTICSLFDSATVREELLIQALFKDARRPEMVHEKARFTNIVTDSYLRNGYPLYVYYYVEDPQCETPVTQLPAMWIGAKGAKQLDEPVLIDPLTGNVFAITDYETRPATEWEAQEFGLYLHDLPLTDYPLIITDRKALAGVDSISALE
ncbi:MAG: beta-galactosidase [Victivallaceae bacterium]|nr:beta-galactosidase [Victivallaceae bacterium]